MEDATLLRARQTNAQLQLFLRGVGEALAGRANFTAEEVRAIAEPVRQMASVVGRAEHLCAESPAWREELDLYARNLAQMDQALDRVRCMLLARRAQLAARRGHLDAVRSWAGAWQQTQ